MVRWGALLCILSVLSACLSQSHVIPHDQLMQLAQTAPERRGERVRVVQSLGTADDPPPAPRVEGGFGVVIVQPIDVAPGPAPRPSPAPAKAESDKAWVWIVLAAALAVGLAATEGARFDGWVEVSPMHPVHLYFADGGYRWMPLAYIDAATAAATERAVVRESEGPWRRLERAPLDRQGFTYSLLLGGAEIPSVTGSEGSGFMGHIQFGYFPSQQIGLQLDFGLSWRDNTPNHATIFDGRNALELDLLPIAAGKVHAGAFGEVGIGLRLEDGAVDGYHKGSLLGGGALLQLELTTRLALTARLGVTQLHSATSTDGTVGISIY